MWGSCGGNQVVKLWPKLALIINAAASIPDLVIVSRLEHRPLICHKTRNLFFTLEFNGLRIFWSCGHVRERLARLPYLLNGRLIQQPCQGFGRSKRLCRSDEERTRIQSVSISIITYKSTKTTIISLYLLRPSFLVVG